jgi:tetratricopeptide (TPR) repeat protein
MLKPTIFISAFAMAACAPYPQRINESPILVNGDQVPAADASTAAPAVAMDREAMRYSADSVYAVATAGASLAVRESIARGEVVIGMNEAQVYAATRSAPVAWIVRRSNSDAVIVPAVNSAPPRDKFGELVMVQMDGGRAAVLSRRTPQGILVASRPQDATALSQAKEAAAALIREGDDLVASNDLAGALNRYDRASVLDPEAGEVQYKAARLLDLQLRPQEALMRYQRFLLSMDIERIRAQGEASAKMAEAIAMAQQRIVILQKQVP